MTNGQDIDFKKGFVSQVPAVRPLAGPPANRPKALLPSTFRMDATLEAYLREIKKIPYLTRSEEEDLARLYKLNRDKVAATRLIGAHLRLVVRIASEIQRSWLDNIQDLIQEGNKGLLMALEKYDPDRGVKFSTYAKYWIKACMYRYVIDNWHLVKLSTSQERRRLFFTLQREKKKIMQHDGLEPDPKLMAERLCVSEAIYTEMDRRLSAGQHVSLDAPVKDGSQESYHNYLPDTDQGKADEILGDVQRSKLVHRRLMSFRETLDGRDLIILDKRLLAEDPPTLREMAEDFGVSRERVRQIEQRLVEKLRKYLFEELPEYIVNVKQ